MNIQDFPFHKIRIVLVNTTHAGNIGAAARAMKNMGLSQLALVQPLDFPSGVATGRAASAVDILEQAHVHQTLEEAVADCGLVIGASARSRKIPWPVLAPGQCAAQVLRDIGSNQVALVFGREDRGLTNEELQLCNFHVQIPASPDYPALNLAAAVLVVCYEVRQAALAACESGLTEAEGEDYWDIERATADQLEQFYAHLEKVLVRLDFHDPDNPRQLMQRMRRLFGRIRMDTMEFNILRGILGHMEYHLENPGGQGAKSRRRRQQQAKTQSQSVSDSEVKAAGSRRRKDFAEAAANKRQLDTMVDILQAARKNRRGDS